jgi:hypothetical protein
MGKLIVSRRASGQAVEGRPSAKPHPVRRRAAGNLAACPRKLRAVVTLAGHTALSRMIAIGYHDYTVMEISGHSSTRMLARYTHPTEERKLGALDLPCVVTTWSQHGTTLRKNSQGRLNF